MEHEYKGQVIESVSWPRDDTGKFKCHVSISKHAGDSVTDEKYFLDEEFETQDEAEQFGVRFGQDVIDRKVPNDRRRQYPE